MATGTTRSLYRNKHLLALHLSYLIHHDAYVLVIIYTASVVTHLIFRDQCSTEYCLNRSSPSPSPSFSAAGATPDSRSPYASGQWTYPHYLESLGDLSGKTDFNLSWLCLLDSKTKVRALCYRFITFVCLLGRNPH
jgi:hypothetical protein